MNIYETVGAFVICCFGVGIAALGIGLCALCVGQVRKTRDDLVSSETLIRVGQRIASSAWWFDKSTALVLREMSSELLHGRWWDENQLRDKVSALTAKEPQ